MLWRVDMTAMGGGWSQIGSMPDHRENTVYGPSTWGNVQQEYTVAQGEAPYAARAAGGAGMLIVAMSGLIPFLGIMLCPFPCHATSSLPSNGTYYVTPPSPKRNSANSSSILAVRLRLLVCLGSDGEMLVIKQRKV